MTRRPLGSGFSLLELLVATALGTLVALAAALWLVHVRGESLVVAERARMQEAAALVRHLLARDLGMAGYLGARMGRAAAGLEDDLGPFSRIPFPTRPLYSGSPWFLAPSVAFYRLRDRLPF